MENFQAHSPFADVQEVLSELSRIPYENLSKVVAFHKEKDPFAALDTPEKMYRKSSELGAGGTCYALTFYLKEKLKEKGIGSEFIIGDKYKIKGVHCALLVNVENKKYLLDPGYMIYQPLLLPENGLSINIINSPNNILVEDVPAEDNWKLYTGPGKDLKFRFDFRKTPVSEKVYTEYWKETFFFQMMQYPVLNKLVDGVQYYLQKNSFIKRTSEGSRMEKIDLEKFKSLSSGFLFNFSGIGRRIYTDTFAKKRWVFRFLENRFKV